MHRVSKTKQDYFCHNSMKLPPPTVIIFGTKMANSPKLCEVHRALNFHLTKLMSMHYRVKRRCSKLLHNAVINSIVYHSFGVLQSNNVTSQTTDENVVLITRIIV